MAKPYRNATTIIGIMTLFAVIGIIVGLLIHSPLVILVFLLPTVIYEVYRTEGETTKLSSFVLLAIYILEIIAIVF
ncbi:MAG: hypothetical protein US52_C0009G0010 [candidate division WS6 bacterium GW2011_GWA2_37_6]|uniref:Phosphatidate cytidylyltransferase n=1 Tax=candidate division WS6 bacterium GW2011_GWA2_37_6 TaxID=1619087 RepID=A0A0G0GYQ9_9BACT|nr:MAG: hypothetical protein US52_C0009G0010 [candidate division WS6 bacterium GW2011_GWA2_37_6]